MAGIEIRGLTKAFRAGQRALDGVDLDVADGELIVLVGPSGSGKTTLLRLLAGLDQPTRGTIRLGGNELAGVPPHRRNVALVFQNLALYSHLSVADNLAFGLNHERSNQRIGETATMLGINHLLHRFPAELSGGEQQRVALGRAIVRQPAALLLDEPLSSLDAPVRRGLRWELKRLQREFGVPTIYVTHDQAEALALGDRIAVLDRGRLQQVGSPDEVYHRPANRFVAEFFGPQGMNLIEGQLTRTGETTTFQTDGWQIELGEHAPRSAFGKVVCGFRPDDLLAGEGDLQGEVTAVEPSGDVVYLQVQVPAKGAAPCCFTARQPGTDAPPPRPRTLIALNLNRNRLHWFDAITGDRLS